MQGMYCLFLIIILSHNVQVAANLWKIEPISGSQKIEPISGSQVQQKCLKLTDDINVVLKQFIGKLLDQFDPLIVPGSNEEKIKCYMEMHLSALDLNKLYLFMKEEGDIYEVEEVLTSIPGYVSSEKLSASLLMTFSEKYFKVIICVIILFLTIGLFLSINLMHIPTWMLIKWFTFLVCIVSFIWNWYFLYQANLAKYTTAITSGPPKECEKNHEKGFFELIQKQISESLFHVPPNKCEEYDIRTSIPPALWVPPTKAISFCIVNTLLEPLSSVGENVGLFFNRLSQNIPIYLQILATISLLIILLAVLFMLNGYTISSFFITIKPSPPLPPPPPQTTPPLQIQDIKELTKKLEDVMAALRNVPDAEEMREMQKLICRTTEEFLKRSQNMITFKDGSGDQIQN